MVRIDWFLPFLRKPKKNAPPREPGRLEQAARAVLPSSLFADRATGKPGFVRRWLKKIGESWLSSPVRRAIQAACFVLFFWLFCYVCWPYTARPSQVWPGWVPTEVDAATGATTVAVDTAPEKQIYSSLVEVPQRNIAKQSVKGIDTSSEDTQTSEAIINATAKALSGAAR